VAESTRTWLAEQPLRLLHRSNRTAHGKWSARTSESATNRIRGGERSAPGRSDRTRTLMIRRGRLLLAIGSGPGRGLPLRSCGAAGALRIARRRKRRSSSSSRSGVWGTAGWGVGRSLLYADAAFAVVVYLRGCAAAENSSAWVLSQPCDRIFDGCD
jgi:hypothetical protein